LARRTSLLQSCGEQRFPTRVALSISNQNFHPFAHDPIEMTYEYILHQLSPDQDDILTAIRLRLIFIDFAVAGKTGAEFVLRMASLQRESELQGDASGVGGGKPKWYYEQSR
jgi:hypothetical protein